MTRESLKEIFSLAVVIGIIAIGINLANLYINYVRWQKEQEATP